MSFLGCTSLPEASSVGAMTTIFSPPASAASAFIAASNFGSLISPSLLHCVTSRSDPAFRHSS